MVVLGYFRRVLLNIQQRQAISKSGVIETPPPPPHPPGQTPEPNECTAYFPASGENTVDPALPPSTYSRYPRYPRNLRVSGSAYTYRGTTRPERVPGYHGRYRPPELRGTCSAPDRATCLHAYYIYPAFGFVRAVGMGGREGGLRNTCSPLFLTINEDRGAFVSGR